jgi:hypothetical protein
MLMHRKLIVATASAIALAIPAAPAMADGGSNSNSASASASNSSTTSQSAAQYGGYYGGNQILVQAAETNQYADAYANAQQVVVNLPHHHY